MKKKLSRSSKPVQNQTQGWAGFSALILAVIVAGVFPLFFRNQFFDINRVKISLLQCSAVVCAVACAALWVTDHAVHHSWRSVTLPKVTLADIGITLFAASAAIATWLSDDRQQALTGEAGRRSGLLFILTLYLMYLVLSRGLNMRRWLVILYFAAGVAAALLGVLNFYKIDPLGFYQNMKESQVASFLSTIGNINFFGLYLCMVLCAGCALFLHADFKTAIPCGAGLFVCFYGVIASRSDGALLGVALLFALVLFYALTDCARLARTAVIICLYGAALLCVHTVGVCTDWYGYPFLGGLCEVLVKSNAPLYLTAAGAAFALLAWLGQRRGVKLPGKRLRAVMAVLSGAAVVAVVALMIYFTCVNPQAQAGALTQFLRFDDAWGTYRGFVWIRSLVAYSQLGWLQKLIGVGPDTMRYVLAAYRDSTIETAASGVFENCHNEYLQYLVTTGALGLTGYVLLAAGSIRNALRSAHSLEGLALVLMLCVYAPLAFVNVNQPVTVVQFFFAASLAACMRNSAPSPIEKVGRAKGVGA